MRLFCGLLLFALLGMCATNAAAEQTWLLHLEVGQCWVYETRHHEPDSYIYIGAIDELEDGRTVVSVQVLDVRFGSPDASPAPIVHLAIERGALEGSLVEPLPPRANVDQAAFAAAHAEWRAALDAGEVRVFERDVSDIIASFDVDFGP